MLPNLNSLLGNHKEMQHATRLGNPFLETTDVIFFCMISFVFLITVILQIYAFSVPILITLSILVSSKITHAKQYRNVFIDDDYLYVYELSGAHSKTPLSNISNTAYLILGNALRFGRRQWDYVFHIFLHQPIYLRNKAVGDLSFVTWRFDSLSDEINERLVKSSLTPIGPSLQVSSQNADPANLHGEKYILYIIIAVTSTIVIVTIILFLHDLIERFS